MLPPPDTAAVYALTGTLTRLNRMNPFQTEREAMRVSLAFVSATVRGFAVWEITSATSTQLKRRCSGKAGYPIQQPSPANWTRLRDIGKTAGWATTADVAAQSGECLWRIM